MAAAKKRMARQQQEKVARAEDTGCSRAVFTFGRTSCGCGDVFEWLPSALEVEKRKVA
jgi:uncharacterized protein YbbK (DUF523 family)